MLQIKNNLFKNNNISEKLDWTLSGAIIGATFGTFAGLAYGCDQAKKEVRKVPIESVTVTYKEPVYQTKEIGKIPHDQYVSRRWGWWGDTVNLTPIRPVYEKVPIKDETGKVVYKEVTKTFTDHGKPIVNYDTIEVKEPVFNGYGQRVISDYDIYCYTYERPDGTMNRRCTEDVVGYWIKFYPKIDYQVIDTYQVPSVKFEHGVDVGRIAMKGTILGMGLGAVVGGILGAVIHSIYEMDKKKKQQNE